MKRTIRLRWIWGMAAVLVVLLIAGTLLILPTLTKASSNTTQSVRTATVSTGTVKATVSASGQLTSAKTSDVYFKASGTVKSVKVATGDKVTKGDVLGTLDTTDLSAAVTSARAALTSARQTEQSQGLSVTSSRQNVTSARKSLAAAKSTLKKVKSGKEKSMTTAQASASVASAQSQLTSARASVLSARAQYTNAQASVTSAQTALTDAQEALSNATLKAPISGTVTTVSVAKGDTVSSGSSSSGSSTSSSGSSDSSSGSSSSTGSSTGSTSSSTHSTTSSSSTSSTAFVITKTSDLELDASFAEADIENIKVGQKASITFPALDSVTATGTITSVSTESTTTNSVVTYAGVITLDSVPSKVRLGQTADAAVTTQEAKNVLYVPSQALTTNSDGTYSVKVLGSNSQQTTTKVTIGVQGDSTVQIKSGLSSGQKVVISTDTAVASASANTTGGSGSGFGGGAGGGTGGGPGGGSGGGPGGGSGGGPGGN